MEEQIGTRKSYILGFLLSLLLTLGAYAIILKSVLTGLSMHIVVGTLGFVQALIQIFMFLHIEREQKPRWNLILFLTMVFTVIIVVAGSLWIMHHLNYNMMTYPK